MDETTKPSIATNIYATALAGLLIFSTFQIGKLGADSIVALREYRAEKNAK